MFFFYKAKMMQIQPEHVANLNQMVYSSLQGRARVKKTNRNLNVLLPTVGPEFLPDMICSRIADNSNSRT